MKKTSLLVILIALIALTGCQKPVVLNVGGSNAMVPLLQDLAQAYTAQQPGLRINVWGGGSTVGIESVGKGNIDIAMTTRNLITDELGKYPDLQFYTLAWEGLALLVDPEIPVDNLTAEQVNDILVKRMVTNWQEVGGPDAEIVVVETDMPSPFDSPIVTPTPLPPPDECGRVALPPAGSVPNGIDALPFRCLEPGMKALSINGFEPTAENVESGAYPLANKFMLVTKQDLTGPAKGFIDFMLSEEGQQLVESLGYVPAE